MSARSLGDTLLLLADADSIIADETDKATLRAAAEVVGRCLPKAPQIVIVQGTGADYLAEQLEEMKRQLGVVMDDIAEACDDIENIKLHVRSQGRRGGADGSEQP